MKLLADENVHSVVIARLRASGFEVEAIAETSPGISDEAILARTDIARLVLVGQSLFMSPSASLSFSAMHPLAANASSSREKA